MTGWHGFDRRPRGGDAFAQSAVPPAVANAIYYATGKRIRSTPFRNHDLSWS